MIATVGGILKGFSIHRNDGTIERQGYGLHNLMTYEQLNSVFLFSTRIQGYATYGLDADMSLQLNRADAPKSKYMLVGTYSQTGNQLTRVSGENLLNNVVYFWESSGIWMNAVSGNTSTAIVSKSLEVPAGSQNLWVIRTDLKPFQFPSLLSSFPVNTISSSYGSSSRRDVTYSNGVFSSRNSSTLRSPSSLVNGLSISGVNLAGANQTCCHIFEFPTPITLNMDEFIVIGVNDFVTTWTWDAYAPRVLASCPLTGISTSCKTQRLSPVLVPAVSSLLCAEAKPATRIYLVSDSNKITLPADFGLITASVPPSSLTPMETIASAGTTITPTMANEHMHGNQGVGTVAVGGLVKQIIWGDLTQLFGVIEFDTPQTINPGQVITIGSRFQVRQDYSIP
jgi:hypothetical protein